MKKVLIITYYWPPAGGPGVHRILRFANCLPEFNWQPIILTVKKPTAPAIDQSLIETIHPDIKVIKTDTFEPFSFYKMLLGIKQSNQLSNTILDKETNNNFKNRFSKFIRANIFIPDARIGWLPFAFKKGIDILKTEKVDLIFSTSPPPSTQLIAKLLAQKSGVKWIADFRDPWTDYYKVQDLPRLKIVKDFDLKLEKSVLRQADQITTVSENIQQLFSQKAVNNYHVIATGVQKIPQTTLKTNHFIIMFIGHLSRFQNPIVFLDMIRNLPDYLKASIEIIFIGNIYEGFKEIFKHYPDIKITIKDYLPYQELIQFAQQANLLLSLYQRGTVYNKGYVSLKIFDYLSLQKPILALGEKGSVADQILKDTKAGKLFDYNDHYGMMNFLIENYRTWEIQKYITLKNTAELEKYSTKTNVAKLTTLFETTIKK
jgi:glycosyltransferase involved in cell wall biosynthesis